MTLTVKTAGIISFTRRGAHLAARLADGLSAHGVQCTAWVKKKGRTDIPAGVRIWEASLAEWTKAHFSSDDALIFVGAAGIAVRSIAPHIVSKKTDPAVIVADEWGRHVISLLSGHIGGANELTSLAAELAGAVPVITTATDLNGKFAVDVFAEKRGMYMDSMPAAKEIAARLAAGEQAGFESAFPVSGEIPPELISAAGTTSGNAPEAGFLIDIYRHEKPPFAATLYLVPRAVTLGIGCRKGIPAEKIEAFVRETFEEYGVFLQSVERIASIDLKKEEAGILSLADAMKVPFETYTAEELEKAESEQGFTESDFVRTVTGVGNVCERSALLGAGTRRLLIPKTARDGITVAAAVRDYIVCMEGEV